MNGIPEIGSEYIHINSYVFVYAVRKRLGKCVGFGERKQNIPLKNRSVLLKILSGDTLIEFQNRFTIIKIIEKGQKVNHLEK